MNMLALVTEYRAAAAAVNGAGASHDEPRAKDLLARTREVERELRERPIEGPADLAAVLDWIAFDMGMCDPDDPVYLPLIRACRDAAARLSAG